MMYISTLNDFDDLMWFHLTQELLRQTKILTCKLPGDTVNDFQKIL